MRGSRVIVLLDFLIALIHHSLSYPSLLPLRCCSKLESACQSVAGSGDMAWAKAIADSGWLYHVSTMLTASFTTAEALHRRGQSVLVHCSDGWDRTAQVCGIAQLLLDPYFRTLRGFCTLVAKEWCSFGHKFHDRAGHATDKHDDSDISPVFLQWLDGVAQLIRMYPGHFEFTTRLPLLVGHHLYSCRFGTFLLNSERERSVNGLQYKTPSLWAHLMANAPALGLLNPAYDPAVAGDALLPHPSAVLRRLALWGDWFLRYAPVPSHPECVKAEAYPQTHYDHTQLTSALHPATAAALSSRASAAATLAAASAAAAAAANSIIASAEKAVAYEGGSSSSNSSSASSSARGSAPTSAGASSTGISSLDSASLLIAAAEQAVLTGAGRSSSSSSSSSSFTAGAGSVPAEPKLDQAPPDAAANDGDGVGDEEDGAVVDGGEAITPVALSYFPQGQAEELPGDDQDTDTED